MQSFLSSSFCGFSSFSALFSCLNDTEVNKKAENNAYNSVKLGNDSENGNDISSLWVTSTEVSAALDEKVTEHMLYFLVTVPEPATATLSLLALAALLARRRRHC